ncbi:MAG: L-threonylcarbamoyladenylate synthase [Gammaproteobacteria bacterium]|nr:L-threonylcarbamoyladenylate synthase [Gammaproteobacteria bacterium]MDH5594904.1 L-threonylcarbamoyladenylate synthase [Gammaproteobacteria bacterium]MDH5613477.1 L-threonylcarbamoyladenylate synthase [Gammaproteobacteria bacterium]
MRWLQLRKAVRVLNHGGIIAYPTESVYGLGCDPNNGSAVYRLLWLKQRSVDKGLILIASSLKQLKPYLAEIGEEYLERALMTWPGPATWLIPASNKTPHWLRGKHNTIAVRVTNHPLASALCQQFKGPVVSTSANKTGDPVTKQVDQVRQIFSDDIDFYLEGAIGDLERPTEIRDIMTNEIIRAG